MNPNLAKEMLDACYTAKRARDLLPPLPEGVTASYIQYLDAIYTAEEEGSSLKISDISDKFGIKRPGITRTINEMEQAGYIKKIRSDKDGRIVYITGTDKGKALSKRYDTEFFEELVPMLGEISEESARNMIDTINHLYEIMSDYRDYI